MLRKTHSEQVERRGTQARRILQPSTFPSFLQRKQWLRSPECPHAPEILPLAPPSASHLTCSLEGGLRICHEKGRSKQRFRDQKQLGRGPAVIDKSASGGRAFPETLPKLRGFRPCRGVGLGCTLSKGQPHLPVPISRGCCPSHGINDVEKEVGSGLSGSWEEGKGGGGGCSLRSLGSLRVGTRVVAEDGVWGPGFWGGTCPVVQAGDQGAFPHGITGLALGGHPQPSWSTLPLCFSQ